MSCADLSIYLWYPVCLWRSWWLLLLCGTCHLLLDSVSLRLSGIMQSWQDTTSHAIKIQSMVRRFRARKLMRSARQMFEEAAAGIETTVKMDYPSYACHPLFSDNYVLQARLLFINTSSKCPIDYLCYIVETPCMDITSSRHCHLRKNIKPWFLPYAKIVLTQSMRRSQRIALKQVSVMIVGAMIVCCRIYWPKNSGYREHCATGYRYATNWTDCILLKNGTGT